MQPKLVFLINLMEIDLFGFFDLNQKIPAIFI